MASGDGGVRPKDAAVTRSATGNVKAVDYKQLSQGNYDEARWDGNEFDSGRSDQNSDTGLITTKRNRKFTCLEFPENPFPKSVVIWTFS